MLVIQTTLNGVGKEMFCIRDIFNNHIAMDCFCYDIIEAWIEFRKSRNMPYDEDSYLDWLENEFMRAMECAFQDYLEDEEDDT